MFCISSRDHGTLGHLCSLLGRLPKAKDPKKELNVCLEALLTILEGHFTAAACQILKIKHPDEEPQSLSAVRGRCRIDKKKAYITNVATEIVEKYTINREAVLGKKVLDRHDYVNNYARVFCHYGSLVYEFTDAWREGDGQRMIRCWSIFLLHFHASKRTKYAFEAMRLKLQLASLPASLAHQLTWDRFVNTHGGKGHNIPCDLFNEHTNKLVKEILVNMGPNLKPDALTRAARSVTTLSSMRTNFDKQSGVPGVPAAHHTRPIKDDVEKVVRVLQTREVFVEKPGRSHSNFPKLPANPLDHLKWEDVKQWIKQKHAKQAKVMKLPLTPAQESIVRIDMQDTNTDSESCSDSDSDSSSDV